MRFDGDLVLVAYAWWFGLFAIGCVVCWMG